MSAKAKPLRFHDLRHSCASLLLANGVSMKEIQEWLGHYTYNVTLQIYAHSFRSAQAAAMDAVAEALPLSRSDK
ncbi:MAG: tyrosine-type recombinase/integrase [Oscillospiraceae bacterium]|nr:tyrosine-type recombinase/integrase [Oscillospiraceae bacterium]